MEKITKYFRHDYENDTTIEYVNTGMYSMLNCSFTSEDPDYGTDTLHWTSSKPAPIAQIAYEMKNRLSKYLDKMDHGYYHDVDDGDRHMFGDYSNSTLYAIENALHEIAEGYHPNKWYMTVMDASYMMASKMLKDRSAAFAFCVVSAEEAKGNPADHNELARGWYGVKRIDGFFDNEPEEFIVAVGYYGGGGVAFAYADAEEADRATCTQELAKAIGRSTGEGVNCWLYVEEDTNKEGK